MNILHQLPHTCCNIDLLLESGYGSSDSCLELSQHEDVRGVNETRRVLQSSPNPYYDDDDDETSKS
jgi:hypothetical protein